MSLSVLPYFEKNAWPKVESIPNLNEQEVHVYRCFLDVVSPQQETCLSPEEQQRAARFQREIIRQRFVASHVGLRCILSLYIGEEPSAIVFHQTELGKPYLPDQPFRFNLAHSGDMALVAVTRAGEVGVDIEQQRKMSEAGNIANKYFHAQEAAMLSSALQQEYASLFLSMWTRKEACVKATGKGLAQSLRSFNILDDSVSMPGDEKGARTLALKSFVPGPDYFGSVAVIGTCCSLVCFTFTL